MHTKPLLMAKLPVASSTVSAGFAEAWSEDERERHTGFWRRDAVMTDELVWGKRIRVKMRARSYNKAGRYLTRGSIEHAGPCSNRRKQRAAKGRELAVGVHHFG